MTQYELLETEEIKNIIDRIAFYTDSNQLEEILPYFSEDAEYKIISDGETLTNISGKPALRESLTELEKRYDFLFHCTGTKIVELQTMSSTALSNTCCIIRQGNKTDKTVQTQYAEYGDKWLKVNDTWFLVSRTVHIVSQSIKEQG